MLAVAVLACKADTPAGDPYRAVVFDSLVPTSAVGHLVDSLFGKPHGHPMIDGYGVLQLGGSRFVVVRVESAHGTGLHQTAYEILDVDAAGQPRDRWSGVATEDFGGVELTGSPSYAIRGCLYSAGDSLLAYVAVGPHGSARLPRDSVLRAAGLYRWDARDSTFRLVAAPDSVLLRRCRSER